MIDKLTEDIAENHHMSLCCVQSELHMGHQHKKTNMWNAFYWKKFQNKENGKYYCKMITFEC
jgi:hypothetical protein